MKTVFELTQYKLFPSPCRGLIFLTRRLSRTNLRQSLRFRPPAGDLSSLQAVNSFCGYKKEFPSPCRGLIFLTLESLQQQTERKLVSVPLQGTYLPYMCYFAERYRKPLFPSPCRGLIFLTNIESYLKEWNIVSVPLQGTYLPYSDVDVVESDRTIGFRPLAGDLSSLQISKAISKNGILFPSPCRGLIFLIVTLT